MWTVLCVKFLNDVEHFIERVKCIFSKDAFNLHVFESSVVCENVDKHSEDTSVL